MARPQAVARPGGLLLLLGLLLGLALWRPATGAAWTVGAVLPEPKSVQTNSKMAHRAPALLSASGSGPAGGGLTGAGWRPEVRSPASNSPLALEMGGPYIWQVYTCAAALLSATALLLLRRTVLPTEPSGLLQTLVALATAGTEWPRGPEPVMGGDPYFRDMKEQLQMKAEHDAHNAAVARLQRRAGEERSTTVPAGEYFLGDPSAVLAWSRFAALLRDTEDGVVDVDGQRLVAYYAAQGNATYNDGQGHRLPTNSRMIALIPISLCLPDRALDSLGLVCRLEAGAAVSRTAAGVLQFGPITVDTSLPPGCTEDAFGDLGLQFNTDDEDDEDLMTTSEDSDVEVQDFKPEELEETLVNWHRHHRVQLPWANTMPAGDYFLGDPAYILNNGNGFSWEAVRRAILKLDGAPFEVDGQLVLCYPVAPTRPQELWTYQDAQNNTYESPSGFLGMIPCSLLRHRRNDVSDCGRFYSPKREVKVSLSKDYELRFGDVCIPTSKFPKPRVVGHVAPAGEYFIGDPERAFDPDYGYNWTSIQTSLRDADGDVTVLGGQKVFTYFTLLPKGTFCDQDGHKYQVTSGMLSVIPYSMVSDVRDLAEYGRIVEFEDPFALAQTEEGLVQVGKFAIPTAEEPGKDEYSMIIKIDREA
eukprot:EG_transcript_6182